MINKPNLLLLAELLEKKADPTHFSMRWLFRFKNCQRNCKPDEVTDAALNECGTTACALGHGPLLFPPEPGEGWHAYSKRVFGLRFFTRDWNFVFAESLPSDPKYIAERIRELVASK